MKGAGWSARLTILALGMAWLGAFGRVTAAEGPSSVPVDFDIPAQPLRDALYLFADQAHLLVSFNASDIRPDLYSRPVKGSYTPEKGLKRLLGRTRLGFDFVDSRTVIVNARPAPAVAREKKEPGPSPEPVEEVVVTGTSIRGAVPVGSPVFVYDQGDFDRAGAATPQQFLSTLTQNFSTRSDDMAPGSSVPGATNDGTYGGSTVDLRGLGSGSTLVLVNGHRQALSGTAEYVDVSLIPLTAVERIEVMLDGASAIYGADAVGGVVNFILLKDYRGYRTRLHTGTTTQGGGTEYQLAQAAGFDWSSGNVLLNYEFYKMEPIEDEQRVFTRDMPGSRDFISGQTKNSLLLSAGQDLFDNLHVSLDALYSKRRGENRLSIPDQSLDKADADNVQSGGTVSMLWQRGPFWSANLDVGASENRIDTTNHNILRNQRSRSKSRYALRYADVRLNGSLFSLPAGPVKLAAGGGYREEDYGVDQISNGVLNSSRRVGDYNVGSAFIELMLPLLEGATLDSLRPRLAVSLAGRYENYDSFGRRINPKFGIEWALDDGLKLRASYGNSFRAPSVQQLDPVAGVYLLQNVVTAAGVQRVISKNGTTSTLGPETSTSWTAGLDFKLGSSERFEGKMTWFDIDYKDRIAFIPGSALLVLTEPAFASVRVLRSDLPAVEFDALVSQALSGQDYRVISGCPAIFRSGFSCTEPAANFSVILDQGLRNLAATRDIGVDVSLQGFFQTKIGAFNLGMDATYLFDYKRRITPLSPAIELVDTIYKPIDLKFRTAVEWIRGDWSITGTLNYTDSYENTAVVPRSGVSSWMTADLSVRYEPQSYLSWLLHGTALILNLQNVFDVDPPFVTPTTQNQIAYDAANADPYGRQISLTITKNW